MQNLSLSKIWQLAKKKGLDRSFADWLNDEKSLYEFKSPTFKKPIDFDNWINARYRMKGILNAENLSADSILDKIAEATKIVSDTLTGKTDTIDPALKQQQDESEQAKSDTRILGLSKGVFILVTVVVVAFVGYGIYSLTKTKIK